MSKNEFESGVMQERARAAEIIKKNGGDARALQVLIAATEMPIREPAAPIVTDSEHERGAVNERLRIVTRLRAMGAMFDPKTTIAEILHPEGGHDD